MSSSIPVPEGPRPLPLVGNLPDLWGGVHDGFPKLIQRFCDPGIFTMHIPSNMVLANLDLAKFGGPTIVCAEPSLLEEMFNRPDEFNKKLFKHSQAGKNAGKGLFACDDDQLEDHDMAARVLLPAFSLEGMQRYFDIIVSCTDDLMTVMAAECTGNNACDLHPLLSKYTFEVITRVGFGTKYNAMTHDCAFLSNFSEQMEITEKLRKPAFRGTAAAMAFLSGARKALPQIRARQQGEIRTILKRKREDIDAGSSSDCPVKDMCTRMLTDPDPKTGKLLPEDVVTQNTLTFLVAGHDSTSSAITMLLYYLGIHPSVEEKVYNEVQREIGDRPLTFEDLSKLTYCTQVVKENLRLAPPAHSFIKNSPTDKETTLGKYRIPAGSSIVVSLWALHYNPRLYSEPFEFRPERWEGEENAKRSPYAWLPFSYGKRGCIGQQLSLIEQRVCLAMLVRKYHIRLDPKTNLTITHPIFMNPKGVWLRIAPRSGSANVSPACVALKKCTANPTVDLGKIQQLSQKKLLVLFGSNMGTCSAFAERLLSKFSAMGVVCQKASLDDIASSRLPEIPKADTGMVLIVASTYNGQPPENAREFASWLSAGDVSAKFEGVSYSVFGCGNSQWAGTYQKFGRVVDTALLNAGSTCIAAMGEADMDGGQAELEFARWSLACIVQLFKGAGIPLPDTLADQLHAKITPLETFVWEGRTPDDLAMEHRRLLLDAVLRMPVLKGSEAWFASVGKNRELVRDVERSTRHIEIALPAGCSYSAGDHLGVYGCNPEAVVLAYLRRVSMAPDAVVRIEGNLPESLLITNTAISAYAALGFFVELQQPATRAQLHFLAGKAAGSTRKRLDALASFEGKDFEEYVVVNRRTLLEVLEDVPEVRVTLGELLALLPPAKPRYYSISSSPKVLPNALSITVSVVQGLSPTGRKHFGLCSNYLAMQPKRLPQQIATQPSGDELSSEIPLNHAPLLTFVKNTGSAFRLPASDGAPIVMIGPGTGLAPMRGFIQDRAVAGSNINLLFFGCRSDEDFLYREELEAWEAAGALELHVGFSRKDGVPKTYVQQLIDREADRVIELLALGAYIYVCGDASRMAPAVRETIVRICEKAGFGGEDFVHNLEEEGRYCQDVWAAQSL